MPKIWVEYGTFLWKQRLVTRTRHTLDRALRALPITQHEQVWAVYLPFVGEAGVPEMAVRVWRRYLKFAPEALERYIDYLVEAGQWNEAAQRLAQALNSASFESSQGRSKHDLWMQLCTMVSQHPKDVRSIDAEAVIRAGIVRFTDEVGRLWVALANYHVRMGDFERARDVFEEAMHDVVAIRDFAMVWDAYSEFEEGLMQAQIEATGDAEPSPEDELRFELQMARYEAVLDRRPLLLNAVLLRQNANNVGEWIKRAELHKEKDDAT